MLWTGWSPSVSACCLQDYKEAIWEIWVWITTIYWLCLCSMRKCFKFGVYLWQWPIFFFFDPCMSKVLQTWEGFCSLKCWQVHDENGISRAALKSWTGQDSSHRQHLDQVSSGCSVWPFEHNEAPRLCKTAACYFSLWDVSYILNCIIASLYLSEISSNVMVWFVRDVTCPTTCLLLFTTLIIVT